MVIDIETVPDKDHFTGEGFPKPPFHKVVAIGFLAAEIERDGDKDLYHLSEMRCGGEASYGEKELIQAFFTYFERLKPRLVSFNGRSFDLPVLKYRAMVHAISAPWLHTRDYNYRYSFDSHCDLMEALTDFGASTRVKLDEVCSVFGFPGKVGMDGSQVKEYFEAGKIEEIRNYCETDILNTYLVYLRYALHTGRLTPDGYDKAVSDLISLIETEQAKRPHLGEFLTAWGESSGNRFLLNANRRSRTA